MNTTAGTTVALSDQYNYDAFGRFDNHNHKIGGSTEYTLDMTYNKAGGITQKDALATGITNAPALNYTLDYSYTPGNHQLSLVEDQKSGTSSHYQYNSSGSITKIVDPAAGGPQGFYWNEEQWLSGVRNDLGVHHYVYDHKGERIMKSSVMQSSVQVNDQNIDDVQYLDPYTLYINPYYVVTELQGGDKVSKHYYMNTQRVATDISINYEGPTPMAGPQQSNLPDPKKPSEDSASVNYNAAFADLQETLAQLGRPKLDVDHMGEPPTLEQYYPEFTQGQVGKSAVAANNGAESITRVLFWYHPDYLGNVDLVTERDGKTYEFFTYNPWGEEMHQYNANTFGFSSPYRFNSKEKDQETGLHYYGARYYQSKLSVWMSVDPLAHETLEPYVFTGNNAVMRIDPDGLTDWELNKDGTLTSVNNSYYVRDSEGNIRDFVSMEDVKEGEEIVDKVFSKDKSSEAIYVKSIGMRGEMPVEANLDGEPVTGSYRQFSNADDAESLFQFGAKHSDVEWSFGVLNDGSGIVGNSGYGRKGKDEETWMTDAFYQLKGDQLFFLCHSHNSGGYGVSDPDIDHAGNDTYGIEFGVWDQISRNYLMYNRRTYDDWRSLGKTGPKHYNTLKISPRP